MEWRKEVGIHRSGKGVMGKRMKTNNLNSQKWGMKSGSGYTPGTTCTLELPTQEIPDCFVNPEKFCTSIKILDARFFVTIEVARVNAM